jgi:hypothetical protein
VGDVQVVTLILRGGVAGQWEDMSAKSIAEHWVFAARLDYTHLFGVCDHSV